ncbi:MAG: hypothetical protein ACREJQ_03730 [bacterium]
MHELAFLKDDGDLLDTGLRFLKDTKIKENELFVEPRLKDFLGLLKVKDRARFLLKAYGAKEDADKDKLQNELQSLFSSLDTMERIETFREVRTAGILPLLRALLVRSVESFGEESLHPLFDLLDEDLVKSLKGLMDKETEVAAVKVRDALYRFQPLKRWQPSVYLHQKTLAMRMEFWANKPDEKLGGLSPFEAYHTPDKRELVLADIYRDARDPQLVTQFSNLLVFPSENRRLIEAFERSGGLLNLFNDWGGRLVDPDWEKRIESAKSEDEIKAAAAEWNAHPSDFFGGLSPQMVVAGGGPEEEKLLDDFLKHCEETLKDKDKDPMADALYKDWMDKKADGKNQTPRETILDERRHILHRKQLLITREETQETPAPSGTKEKKRKKEKARRR